jgi:glutamate-ammonia-ligase adenylyltransferase
MSNFEQALQTLPQPLQPELLRHWQSYRENAQHQDITPPHDTTVVDQLIRVWAASDFVARTCVRQPKLLEDLLGSGDLYSKYPIQRYHESLEQLLSDSASDSILNSLLRQYRLREMVRIAWRDLAGLAPLQETLQDLSDLADAAIDIALHKLYLWQCQRFGTPQNEQGEAQQLVVLAMGKLGGQELNFSSDIDLIFAYPQKGQTDGKRAISNEEFFRKLGQRLIKTLQEITSEGFVYRVDMRLRPFGEAGPLAMPFNAFEDYYQNHGRDWERYAMIKARVVAGDKTAGAQLLNDLKPFIYRRYLDYSAFESLRNMKALISQEVERKGMQRNIKLGPGGIREIEFIAQAFQLIYGGREPQLRERCVLPVLSYLADTERLSSDVVDGLKQAYEFLRRSENRLQAWADQQTHDLPTDELARLRLAYAMGFTHWQDFADVLTLHVQRVREPFAMVFAATPEPDIGSHETGIDFNTIWNAAGDDETVIEYLRSQGFSEPGRVLKSLGGLHDSFSYRALSEQGRIRLKQLLPLLLQAVSKIHIPQHHNPTIFLLLLSC